MKWPSTPVTIATQSSGVVAEAAPRVGEIAEVVEVERVAGLGAVDRDASDVVRRPARSESASAQLEADG